MESTCRSKLKGGYASRSFYSLSGDQYLVKFVTEVMHYKDPPLQYDVCPNLKVTMVDGSLLSWIILNIS